MIIIKHFERENHTYSINKIQIPVTNWAGITIARFQSQTLYFTAGLETSAMAKY